MKRLGIVCLLNLLAGAAYAQQPAPFTPYTIDAQTHEALLNYLGEVPAKYANRLINQLSQMEQKAQHDARVAAAKKAADDAKPETKKLEPKK